MARSCAFRIGPRRFELVVLDGSPKKHKIAAYYVGEFELDPEGDPVQAKAAALRDAARKHRIPTENVSVVMSAQSAAFRRLVLPFSDRAKIEQVLKFEVEGDLPQFSIDQVVVDHHVLAERDGGAEILVTAVPKAEVAHVLAVCEKAGIEPLEVELETSALVNAAMSADLCHLDDAQVLVHIGEQATSVVVMDGGEAREMRIIHIGAATHDVPPTEGEEGEVVEPVDPLEAARRMDQAIKRIRRELGRTIGGARTINRIDAVYVSGMELPGLVGGTIMDVPVYILDCFEADSGQPADGYGQLVAAYGGAYRQLGGGTMRPSLRREELKFTGAWERLEFPVALVALLAATFLGLICIVQKKELAEANYNGAWNWLVYSNHFAVGSPKENKPGRIKPPIKALVDRAERIADSTALPPDFDPVTELQAIDSILKQELEKAQGAVGDIQEVEPPQSAFVALTLVLGQLEQSDTDWRVSVRRAKATTVPPRGGGSESVEVQLDVTFWDASPVEASRHFEAFRRKLQEQPWCLGVDERAVNAVEEASEPHAQGVAIDGLPIRVDVSKYEPSRT